MEPEGDAGFEAPTLETRRVYDAASVDEYIAGLERELEAQRADAEVQRAEVAELRQLLDQAQRAAASAQDHAHGSAETEILLGRALLTAQRTADEITAEADRRADVTLAEARRQADDMLATARLQAAHLQAGRLAEEATGTNGAHDRSTFSSDPAPRSGPAPEAAMTEHPAGGVWAPPPFPSGDGAAGLVGLPNREQHTWARDSVPFDPPDAAEGEHPAATGWADDPGGPRNGDSDPR